MAEKPSDQSEIFAAWLTLGEQTVELNLDGGAEDALELEWNPRDRVLEL